MVFLGITICFVIAAAVSQETGEETVSYLQAALPTEVYRDSTEPSSTSVLMQISNDHSDVDNEGYQDEQKIIFTFVISGVVCLLLITAVQGALCLSKKYRYSIVRLRKNYATLRRTSQLAKAELERSES